VRGVPARFRQYRAPHLLRRAAIGGLPSIAYPPQAQPRSAPPHIPTHQSDRSHITRANTDADGGRPGPPAVGERRAHAHPAAARKGLQRQSRVPDGPQPGGLPRPGPGGPDAHAAAAAYRVFGVPGAVLWVDGWMGGWMS